MATFRTSAEEARTFLSEVLTPQFQFVSGRWAATAKELSGLKLLRSICQSHGTKRLRSVSRSGAPRGARGRMSLGSPSKDSALHCLLRSPLTRRMLRSEVLEHLQTWTIFTQDPLHEHLLQHFIQRLHELAVGEASSVPQKTKQLRARYNVDQMKDFKTAFEMATPTERAHLQLRGNTKLTNWISHVETPQSSSYQDTYTEGFLPRRSSGSADFYTSAVWRVLPEGRMNYRLISK